MDKGTQEKYVKAGRIAAEARELAASLAKPGAKIVEIAEQVEDFIRKKGAAPAFPLNISRNDEAAHYTPIANDAIALQEGEVVKLDVGASVDGFIADTAATVVVGGKDAEKQKMVDTINKALEAALKLAKPGAKISEIGATIEDTITAAGFKPIRNLSGHLIENYIVHAGVTIPNIKTDTKETLEAGSAYAIEPFLTNGAGTVKESEKATIYKYEADVPARSQAAREILRMARETFNGIPFAVRWIKKYPPVIIDAALRELVAKGGLYKYGVLKESAAGLVAQAEHTVLVLDEPIVITKL